SRRRLGDPRRQGAPQAAPVPPIMRDSLEMQRFSISQVTTLTSTFAEDVAAYQRAGVEGIGVWELKLPGGEDEAALEIFEASGLGSAAAVPLVPSILPLPLMDGPADPSERVDAICRAVHRLAPFRPSGIVCLTGPAQERDPDEARAIVVDGLRTIADEAASAGVRIGLEPINRIGGESWTTISTIPAAGGPLGARPPPAPRPPVATRTPWDHGPARRDTPAPAPR